MLGTIIGHRYRVEGILGRESQDAFSIVYLCHDIDKKRLVALKTFPGAIAHDREFLRFKTEAQIVGSLDHPNIINIIDIGFHDDVPFVAMEYLSGRSLKEVLSQDNLSSSTKWDLLLQIASGLSAIHNAGVLHGNLSSQNILVTDTGVAKILDFSMAKDLQIISNISHQGERLGSVPYLSPEQITGEVGTPVSDVFGFGILLYEVITGNNPFASEHPISMLYNIANRNPAPIASLVANLPISIAELSEACLAKQPGDRPQDMHSIVRVFAELTGLDHGSKIAPTKTRVDEPRLQLGHGETAKPTFNPYLNRTMLRNRKDFFGRKALLRKIFSSLNSSQPGSISIVGDRRIGKSSLLNFIYMKPTRESYLDSPDRTVVVFLDFQEETNMSLEAFYRMLIRLTQMEARELFPSGSEEPIRFSANVDGVKKLIEYLDEHSYKLILLLDEFEAVTFNPNFDFEFFAFLRFLANHYNVAYVTSSTRDLQQLCHTKEIANSPFFNIFTTVRLSAFSQEEAEDLIRMPSEKVGRPLAPYSEEIMKMAGRFPFFLQILCAQAIDYWDAHPDQSEPDFESIRAAFLEEAGVHFRFIWNTFDRYEKAAVFRIVENLDMPENLGHVVQELQLRGLVAEVGGRPAFLSQYFSEFIKSELSHSLPTGRGRPFATSKTEKINQLLGITSEGWLDRAIRKRILITVLGAFGIFGAVLIAITHERGNAPSPSGPLISVLHPPPSRGFKVATPESNLEVKLSVSDPDGVDEVTINGVRVAGDNSIFTSIVSIQDGLNEIPVRARDGLGNASELVVRVQGDNAPEQTSALRKGRDYALLFGCDEYEFWRPLTNAVLDASTIGETLERDYGFIVEVAENKTKSEMFQILRNYQNRTFTQNDQLFVFVAGHGYYDTIDEIGYIVSRDSQRPREDPDRNSMFPQSLFVEKLDSIPCEHTLVTLDVCFSGAFFKKRETGGSRGDIYDDVATDVFIEKKLILRTRKFITSSGVTEVLDGVRDQHSPFARRFLEALSDYGENDFLTAGEMFHSYLKGLDSEPMIGSFGNEDVGSDFLFIVQRD